MEPERHQTYAVGRSMNVFRLWVNCTKCHRSIEVALSYRRDAQGRPCLVQQPRDCVACGERIFIRIVADPTLSSESQKS
jgi:hypothetical protein